MKEGDMNETTLFILYVTLFHYYAILPYRSQNV